MPERASDAAPTSDAAPPPSTAPSEPDAVLARYSRRASASPAQLDRYNPLNADVLLAIHERQKAIVRVLRELRRELAALTLVEVGCGNGANLLEFLRLGFAPENLSGVELIEERYASARARLPESVRLTLGDANALEVPAGSVDIVLQSTVFSSLLDEGFQHELADRMWSWVAPGGGVLWYDFVVDNPRNPDVRGIPRERIRALFPHAHADFARVTLAPPLARPLARRAPALLGAARAVPLLRTHVVGWLAKPS